MSQTIASRHIEPEELADYFESLLQEDRNSLIEEHFAECAVCTAQAREFRAFSLVWDDWTAEAHGKAYRQVALTSALQTAMVTRPEWQERLRRWRERWSGAAESALQSIRAATIEASRVIIEGLETSVPIGTEWRFALATEVPSISGSARSGGVPVRGAVATNRSVSRGAEKSQERVTAKSDTGEVEVVVDGWQPGRPASLVLLIDLQGNHPPLVQELIEEQAGTAVARFSGVAPGEYVVAFEPEE